MTLETIINSVYLLSAISFILGLKKLGNPATARQGNLISALGMLLAVVVTLWHQDILDYRWIILGIVLGSIMGTLSARLVAMTAMPEMVALFNGFGGMASLLVGYSLFEEGSILDSFVATTIYLAVFIGGLTFTGSGIAWAKLNGKLPGRPLIFMGQHIFNILLLFGVIILGILFSLNPAINSSAFYLAVGLSLLLGILIVLPIGGADMPVVISLLNSCSGLAAVAAGFALQNNLLIVSGALVGASGIILTVIMCKAMNRSLGNVLFSRFGSFKKSLGVSGTQGEAKSVNVKDSYYVLEAANKVVIIPGYGLAVAQAQHVLQELGEILEANDTEVLYAIHPVAGRMPGHMNVLLAEANVPYEQLVDMDAINAEMDMVDVALVIGANDVVNPSAREDESSPLYGMPVINADVAQTVYVLKRSMASGFSGLENPLFFKDNTEMIFGDAKQTLQKLVAEFKES